MAGKRCNTVVHLPKRVLMNITCCQWPSYIGCQCQLEPAFHNSKAMDCYLWTVVILRLFYQADMQIKLPQTCWTSCVQRCIGKLQSLNYLMRAFFLRWWAGEFPHFEFGVQYLHVPQVSTFYLFLVRMRVECMESWEHWVAVHGELRTFSCCLVIVNWLGGVERWVVHLIAEVA
jgi:hypothetical protein